MTSHWGIILLESIVAYGVLFLLGEAVLYPRLKEKRAYFSPVVGYLVYSYLFYLLFHITTQAWMVWGVTGLLAGGSLFLFLRRQKYPALIHWVSMLFALGIAGYVLLILYPEFDAGYYFLPSAAYDHVKAAIIPAMEQGGIPVPNPFGAFPPHLHYYLLFYVPGTCLKILTGATVYSVELVNSMLACWMGVGALFGVVRVLRGKPFGWRDIAFCSILLFSTAAERHFPFMSFAHGMDNVITTSLWAPQTLMAASFLLLAVVCVHLYRWKYKWLVALLLAGSMGASVYIALVAALGFGLFLLADWGGRRNRLPILWQGVQVGLFSLLLALPFIWNQTGAMYDIFPVAVHIYPWSRNLHPVLAVLGFWTVYYFLQMPVTFLLAVWGMTKEHLRKYTLFYVMIFASAFITCFLKTIIDNNDLGWRAVLISIMLLIALATCRWSTASRIVQWPVVLTALLMVNFPISRLDRFTAWVPYKLKPLSAQSIAAIRQYVSTQDYFVSNPLDLPHSGPWHANLDFMLLTERRSCYASGGAVYAYCRFELRPLYKKTMEIFDGDITQADVDEVRRYKCNKFIFHKSDKNFKQDAALAAVGLRKIYQNEQIKIYE